MKICPRCKKHCKELQKRVQDKKTKKNWLITYCGDCSYNFEIEESEGGTTPDQELNGAQPPIWDNQRWQTYL